MGFNSPFKGLISALDDGPFYGPAALYRISFSRFQLNRNQGKLQSLCGLEKTEIFIFYFLFIFEIFTICFKEAISKLSERLHFERRCYPVIVLPRVEHFQIIIVFYFNTSVATVRVVFLWLQGGRVVGSLVRLSVL